MGVFADILALLALAGPGWCQSVGAWQELAPVPIGTLQEHTTLAITPTLLATVGGLIEGGSTTNAFLLYDVPNNTWKRAANLPIGLNHPNAVTLNGKLYVVGGLQSVGGVYSWRGVPDTWAYDPTADSWTPLASMPAAQARGSAAVGVFNTTIFMAGGIPGGSGRTMDVVSAYDVAANKWLDLPAAAAKLPGARDHACYGVVGHRFFIIGGRENGITNVKDTVFVLDLENLEAGWKTSAAKMPTGRGGLAAGIVGTKIFTFGGEGNPTAGSRGVWNQTEVYDTETDSWASLPAMKLPRHGTSAVGVNGKVFIPGGGIVQGVGATEVFDVFIP
jgi:hypothetical protein